MRELSDLTPIEQSEFENRTTLEEEPSPGGRSFTDLTPLGTQPSVGPLIGQFKQLPTLVGWEATFARKAPRLYAMHATMRSLIPIPQAIPGAGFVTFPSERKAYESLSDEDKIISNAFAALEGVLWVAGGPILKGIGKGVVWGGRKIGRLLARKPLPFDEAIRKITSSDATWGGFDVEKTMREVLTKKEKFTSGEADAIYRVLHGGNPRVLNDAIIEKAFSGKKMSKAWEAGVKRSGGGSFGDFDINPGLLKNLKLDILEHAHYETLYKTNLKKTLFKGEKTGIRFDPEKVMKVQLAQLYGAEQAKLIGLGEIGDRTAAILIADMLRPRGAEAIRKIFRLGAGELTVPWFNPERVIFGLPNAVLGVKDKILDVVDAGMKRRNGYLFGRSFEYMKKLSENGFGTISKKEISGKLYDFKFKPNKAVYTRENVEAAHKIMAKVDELTEAASVAKPELAEQLQGAARAILKETKPNQAVVAKLIDTTYGFYDNLYKEYIVRKIPSLLRRDGLTITGEQKLASWMAENGPRIERVFAEGEFTPSVKAAYMPVLFKDLQKTLLQEGNFIRGKIRPELIKELSLGKKGNFPGYLENYHARVYQRGVKLDSDISRRLTSNASGFFTKARKMLVPPKEARVDFATTIETRIRSQANDLFLFDALDDASRFASKLPDTWRLHTEHLVARALNKPSLLDHGTAQVFQRILGKPANMAAEVFEGTKVGPWFEQFGRWDAARVMKAAQVMNNMTYHGLLGLKPFSVMRNLLQPLLTVPADLGGFKDFYFLARGTARAVTKSHRDYIRSIGAIAEFIPELRPRSLVFRHGRKIGGVQLPELDAVRDSMLFAYRGSDRWNRYVTGGAALEKWEWAAAKVPGGVKSVSSFLRKIKAHGRNPNVTLELEELLKAGRVDDAKALWVNDVIQDTQFLYDRIQSPSALHAFGGVGRTATIFQSWWMNYGSLIGKWARTGDAELKVERLATAMTSAFVAEQIAEFFWGRPTALRTVAFGPLPFERFPSPPVWKPVWDGIQTIGRWSTVPFGGDIERATQSLKSALRSLPRVTLPAGHQIETTIRGAQEGGWEGVAKSIIRFHSDPLYEPLYGAQVEEQHARLIPPGLMALSRIR